MPTTVASHIVLDEKGRPWIEGTNTKVIEVVLDKVAWGWDADEIHRQHPHLPLAKIHAALSYYYDHQKEMDAEIERQQREVDAMAAKAVADSPLRKKLRDMGALP
jgi:uncharacterized protein (DUF433 family)